MKSCTLNIEAPASLTRRLIAQSLPRFLHAHPGVRVFMRDVNPTGRMLTRNADAAICIGPITDPNLIANEVGAVRSITCASADFVASEGVPSAPADVDPRHCIAVFDPGTQRAQEWLFRRNSDTYAILPTGPLAFSDGDSAVAAAVRGGGYVQVLCFEVEQQIAAGLLQPVLSEWNAASQPVAVIHARDGHQSRELLAFQAFVANLFPAGMNCYPSVRKGGTQTILCDSRREYRAADAPLIASSPNAQEVAHSRPPPSAAASCDRHSPR